MPGSTPATSQLDWLISTTAMIVLSWSKATRDLLKSFGWGIRALHQLVAATMVPSPRRLPHTISALEGDGFELPVPRKLGLRRGRRLALHLGSLNAPAARPRLERDQAAPGFGEEGEHCRRVIKRRATASKARPELGALLGLKV